MIRDYNVGDRVRCVKPSEPLVVGNVYTVARVDYDCDWPPAYILEVEGVAGYAWDQHYLQKEPA